MEQNELTSPFGPEFDVKLKPAQPNIPPPAKSSMVSKPETSPAINKTADRVEKLALEKETERLFSAMGIDKEEASKELLQEEKQKLALELEKDIEKFKEEERDYLMKAGAEALLPSYRLARGAVTGLQGAVAQAVDMVAMTANAVYAQDTSDTAVRNGPVPLINYRERLNSLGLTETEKKISEITQELAPLAASFTPGGALTKIGAGAMASFLMLDPKRKTLANLAEGTAFEKSSIGAPIVQNLKKEDDDTFLVGGFKNVVDYIVPEVAASLAVINAARLVSAAGRGEQALNKYAKDRALGLNIPKAAQVARTDAAEINLAYQELSDAMAAAKKQKVSAPRQADEAATVIKEQEEAAAASVPVTEAATQVPVVAERVPQEGPEQLELGIPKQEPPKKQYAITQEDLNILTDDSSGDTFTQVADKIRSVPSKEFLSKDGRKFTVEFSTIRLDEALPMLKIRKTESLKREFAVPTIVVKDMQKGGEVIATIPLQSEFAFGIDTIASGDTGYLNAKLKTEYSGLGIIENAYLYGREHIENFSPSVSQTAQGAAFTNRIAMKSAIEQPDMFVRQQLRKNLEAQRQKLLAKNISAKTPEQLKLMEVDKTPKPTEQEFLNLWNKDVAFNTVEGVEAAIKELDEQIATSSSPQLSLPGLQGSQVVEEVVDNLPELGTKEFDAKVKEYAKELRDELAPVGQGVFKDGSRPLDELFDKYTGELLTTLENPRAITGDERAALRESIQKLMAKAPQEVIEHNGKSYRMLPYKNTIYAIPEGVPFDEAIMYNKAPYVTLDSEVSFGKFGIGDDGKFFKLPDTYYLTPSFISMGRRGGQETPGLVLKMLRYVRQNVGEVQESANLLAAGRNFMNKLPKRLDKLTALDYEDYARDVLTKKKQEVLAIKNKQASAAADQLDILTSKQDALEQRRRELIAQEQIEMQDEFLRDPNYSGWERVAGIDTPPVYINEAKEVAVNSNSASLVEAIADAYAKNPESFTPRDPQEVKTMVARARAMVSSPEGIQNLLGTSAQRPLQAEERIALDLIREKLSVDALKKIRTAVDSNADLDLIAAKEAIDAMTKLSNKALGTNSEAGRSLGIIRSLGLLAKSGDEEAIKLIGQAGRNKLRADYISKYGKENLESLIKQYDMIAGIKDEEFAVRFDEVVRRSKYMRTMDAMFSVYVNGLLRPATAFTVVGSNAATTIAEAMSKFVAVGVGKITNSADAITVAEAATNAVQLANNFNEAFAAGYNAAKAGSSKYVAFDVTTPGVSPEAALANSAFEKVAESGVLFLEKAAYSVPMTLPTRSVIGADAFSSHIVMNAGLTARGTSLGVQKGLKGDALKNFVANFVEKPPEDVLAEVTEEAKRIAMQRDLTDTLVGKSQQVVEQDPTGILRFFHPFANNTTNSIVTALEYSPFAPSLNHVRKAIGKGGRGRDMALARMATGSAFATAVGGLVSAGILELKKEDYKQLNALDAEGEGRISATLKIGDKAYPISWLDPLGRALNVVAHAYPSVASSEDEMDRNVATTTLSAYLGYLDPAVFEMYGELYTLVKTAKSKEELPAQFQKMLAGALPIPLENTVKAVSTIWNPEKGSNISDKDEVASYFVRRLKDAYGFGLAPQRNILGYPVKEYNGLGAWGPFGYSEAEPRPIYKKLQILADYNEKTRRAGFEPLLNIEMPEKEINVVMPKYTETGEAFALSNKVRLTSQEYDKLIVTATTVEKAGMNMESALNSFFSNEGKYIASRIDDLVSGTGDPEIRREKLRVLHTAYANHVKSIIKSYYDTAKMTMAQDPEIQARAYENWKQKTRLKDQPLMETLELGE